MDREVPTRFRLARCAVVGTALLAPVLGGSTGPWSQGVVLLLVAALVFLLPPNRFVGRTWTLLAAGALLLGATAFLPVAWFGRPWWGRVLADELQLAQPGTLSAQPWVSADSMVLLLGGLLWLLVLTGQEWTRRDRLWLARGVCGGVIVLSAVWLVVHYAGWRLPIWVCDRNFGPFPNRNQTGDLLATWAAVAAACALEDFRQKRWRAIFWLSGIAIILWGLIVNFSRAGILLFFAGLAGWGMIQLSRSRSWRAVSLGVAGLIAAGSLFVLFGGATLERFSIANAFGADLRQDFRALIFQDAWNMALASPICGVGLGNFEPMFALAREASSGKVRLIHPESDWLWLLDETGWLGPLLALGMIALFVWRSFPWEDKSARLVRTAALVGALLFALHGFVDVSGHRLGSAIPALLLFALAAQLPPLAPLSLVQPWVARAGALVVGAVGLIWVVASVRAAPLAGRVGAAALKSEARATNQAELFPATVRAVDRAAQWTPLDWELHFLRGVAHAYLEQPEVAALDFRRARRLEPTEARVTLEEGHLWAYFDPARARAAWAETLRRDPDRAGPHLQQMIAIADDDAGLRAALRDLAADEPALLVTWLGSASRAEFEAELDRLRTTDPSLAAWTPAQLTALLRTWLRSGDRAALLRAFETTPRWQVDAWRVFAAACAQGEDFQRACAIVGEHLPAPKMPQIAPRPLEEAARDFVRNPRDFLAGYRLAQAQLEAGQFSDALATFTQLAALPGAPPYLAYLRAQTHQRLGQWREAWLALEPALR